MLSRALDFVTTFVAPTFSLKFSSEVVTGLSDKFGKLGKRKAAFSEALDEEG